MEHYASVKSTSQLVVIGIRFLVHQSITHGWKISDESENKKFFFICAISSFNLGVNNSLPFLEYLFLDIS